MILWGFLTCRSDLVVVGERSALPVGLSAGSISSGAGFSIVGDNGLIGESPHLELEGGSCSRGLTG